MALGVGVVPHFCKLFSSDTNILNLKIVDGLCGFVGFGLLFFGVFFFCLLVCVLNTVVISSAIGISLEKPECLSLQCRKVYNGFEFILPILIIVAKHYCQRS